jgi:hypothetical protein
MYAERRKILARSLTFNYLEHRKTYGEVYLA